MLSELICFIIKCVYKRLKFEASWDISGGGEMVRYSQRLSRLKGSVIREIFKMMADPEIISLGGGSPAAESYPFEAVRSISDQLLREKGLIMLEYGLTTGYLPLREAYLEILVKGKGVKAGLENTICFTGSGQGIFIILDVFIDPGDVVLVENPTFLATLNLLRKMNAKIVGVDMDENGIIIEDLKKKIRQYKPKLLYTIPTFQNPSGRTISRERRQKIAEFAAQYDMVILEDDPYADVRFRGEAVPPIKSFDQSGNVIMLNSFSKIIAPGLRVGAATAKEEWIEKMELVKQGVDTHTATFSQAICAEFLIRGLLPEHLKKVGLIYKQRYEALEAGIKKYFPPNTEYTKPDGGLFVWARIPGVNMMAMNKQAVSKYKVAFIPGNPFYVDETEGQDCLRLNFSSSEPAKIETACQRLGQLFAEELSNSL